MSPSEAALWLPARRTTVAPRVRLLCLPYAGGGATIYHRWTDALASDIEVRPVQLPARQNRRNETPLTRVDAIVTPLVAAIDTLPAAPTAIFGHSFGGLVAYELARRLTGAGRPPIALVVGARHAPHVPQRAAPIHALPTDAFVQTLHRRYGTAWTVLGNRELMALALPSLRADFEAYERYEHRTGPRLATPITVLHGLQDATLTREQAEAWGELTSAEMSLHSIDAGHFFVDTHREWVLAQVRRALEGVEEAEGAEVPCRGRRGAELAESGARSPL
jgi:medium-chain acyl-[acyl-carrier-protein] hydrolase